MAAVTVYSDFGAQEEEICHYFHLFLFYLPCSNGAGCHDLSCLFVCFLIFRLKPALSLFFFTLIKRLFSLSLLSANRVVSSENPHRKKLTPISWLLTSLPLFLFPFSNTFFKPFFFFRPSDHLTPVPEGAKHLSVFSQLSRLKSPWAKMIRFFRCPQIILSTAVIRSDKNG